MGARPRGKVRHFSEPSGMAEHDNQIPETQMERAQWLADELALCGWDEITAIEILDALACAGLKLMPDKEGVSSQEYIRGHKSVIRSAKADLN
jgi:hypothetical protein